MIAKQESAALIDPSSGCLANSKTDAGEIRTLAGLAGDRLNHSVTASTVAMLRIARLRIENTNWSHTTRLQEQNGVRKHELFVT
jgi:hypothetical protein